LHKCRQNDAKERAIFDQLSLIRRGISGSLFPGLTDPNEAIKYAKSSSHPQPLLASGLAERGIHLNERRMLAHGIATEVQFTLCNDGQAASASGPSRGDGTRGNLDDISHSESRIQNENEGQREDQATEDSRIAIEDAGKADCN
jgi:hypothetical protein